MKKNKCFFMMALISISAMAVMLTSCNEVVGASSAPVVPKKAYHLDKIVPLKVDGNKIVTPSGQQVILRGLALIDPLRMQQAKIWNETFFDEMKKWNANIIRIAITPELWRKMGKEYYIKNLKKAISWSKKRNIYIIIDWHSIGNLKDKKFQRPNYNTDMKETLEFWNTMSKEFAGEPTIAFYEIFNEPTTFFGKLGKMTWDEWKTIVEDISKTIRKNDKDTVILAGGLKWCYDLTAAKAKPFDVDNLAYSIHPYPQKSRDDKKSTMEEKWDETWGFIAKKYPMVATEFGFMSEDEEGAHNPCISDDKYGKRLINYFEKNNISWTVWCFHWGWKPALINKQYEPTTLQGKFFYKVLTEDITSFKQSEIK